MYTPNKPSKTTLNINKTYPGEPITRKINRILNNKEPISDGAPIVYTEREEGVPPQYDIRTDRWEHAIDALDKHSKSHQAKREQRIGEKSFDTMTPDQQKAFHEKFPGNKFNKPKEGGA